MEITSGCCVTNFRTSQPLSHVKRDFGRSAWAAWSRIDWDKMLLLSNRMKFCSAAVTVARMCSSGPAAAKKNPTVYFDIAADNQQLGRVTFEVRRLFTFSVFMFGLEVITPARSELVLWFFSCTDSKFSWEHLVHFLTLRLFLIVSHSSTLKSCQKLQVTHLHLFDFSLTCITSFLLSNTCNSSG